MGLNIDEEVLMGMGIESVRIQEGNFEILTPGACVTLQSDGTLNIRQRIGTERELLSCRLPAHLTPWRLARWTPFRCVLEGNGLNLTIQGDSVLIFEPHQHLRLAFKGYFKSHYAQEVRGNRLLLDPLGGCGFFGIPPRVTEVENLDQDSWELTAHLARFDELWVSVCPPRPLDQGKFYQSIAHEGGGRDEGPYPSNESIRGAAKHCQIFTVHSGWTTDAPEWAENPPGSHYTHPMPDLTDRSVPADPVEFARVRDEARRLGMKFIPYLSPYFSNSPDIFAEMERVLKEYEVDGLYFDGWCGHRDDFRPGYHLMRRARAILGDRILYLHSSSEPFGNGLVTLPFVFAYADYVLSGESSRFGLELDEFLRYAVSGYQISNTAGVWCHYGSWSDEPGYHFDVPSTEHIEMALRNHVQLWRQAQIWSKSPEELARFDREYYGGLAKLVKGDFLHL
ncbi:MAG: hypothetical protein KAV99_04355 [Candidatus Latescibacteria bacterium]|nr:hypothetical protein [Candidatus Latescibacterota bacterium]